MGHGVGSFPFPVAEKALEWGFDDFAASSDLYVLSTPFRARNFANVLGEFLAIGVKLEDVMDRCTMKAAPIVGLERDVAEGKPAVLTIFRVEEGRFRFRHCGGELRTGRRRIVPTAAVHEGELLRC